MQNNIQINNAFALGGIACGFLEMDDCARVTKFCPAPFVEISSPFEIKLWADGKTYSLLDGGNCAEFTEGFPFLIYKMSFGCVDVTLSAFNPFLPLNCADSQIPAVLFEVSMHNNSSKPVSAKLSEHLEGVCGFADSVNSVCLKHDGESVFTLEAGEVKTVKLCFGWHFPYDNEQSIQKNYYSQYFVDANECVDYCIKHFDRLKKQSEDIEKMLFDTTIPKDELGNLISEIKRIKSLFLVRKNNGTMLCAGHEKQWARDYAEISSIAYFFPELDRDCVQYLLKAIDYNDTEMCLYSVLCAYRYFVNSANVDELIENWYYISKGIDIQDITPQNEHFPLYAVRLGACCVMAQAVKDRARKSRYEKQYITAKNTLIDLECDINKALKSICFDIGCKEPVCDFVPNGVSSLYQKTGFEYNAYTARLCVCPNEKYFDDSYEFKSFYCVSSGYGYIQADVDSIEIISVSGKIALKSIKVPRKPRMLLYGGRKWRFSEKDGCVVPDNVLEITQDKKLCIIIDAARTI